MRKYWAAIVSCSPKDAQNDKFCKVSPRAFRFYCFVKIAKLNFKIETRERNPKKGGKENRNNNDCTQTALLCNVLWSAVAVLYWKIAGSCEEWKRKTLKNQFNFIVILACHSLTTDVTFRGFCLSCGFLLTRLPEFLSKLQMNLESSFMKRFFKFSHRDAQKSYSNFLLNRKTEKHSTWKGRECRF